MLKILQWAVLYKKFIIYITWLTLTFSKCWKKHSYFFLQTQNFKRQKFRNLLFQLHTRIRKFKIISYHQPVNFCFTLTLHISFQNCIIEYFKFQYWLNFEYSQKLYSLYTAMLWTRYIFQFLKKYLPYFFLQKQNVKRKTDQKIENHHLSIYRLILTWPWNYI